MTFAHAWIVLGAATALAQAPPGSHDSTGPKAGGSATQQRTVRSTAPATAPDVLSFQIQSARPAPGAEKLPPYFRVFEGGKDKSGKDASTALGILKTARGTSKLYPKEDQEPGLMVALNRLSFIPQPQGDAIALFEGEFNATQGVVSKADMDKLRAGETVELVFYNETTKGVRPVSFTVKTSTKFRLALKDGQLEIYGGEGKTNIIHYGVWGSTSYESRPLNLKGDDRGDGPIYLGVPLKPEFDGKGKLKTLPLLNESP